MFEWQKQSQSSIAVPHFKELLEFINLRTQASEGSTSDQSKRSSKGKSHHPRRPFVTSKPVSSFATSTIDPIGNCVLCKTDKHPLYVCPMFKSQPHDKMMTTLKANDLCMNCLRPGHYVKQCKSLHRCRKCQKQHHTLLHIESKEPPPTPTTAPASDSIVNSVPVHTTTGITSNSLLMTCRVLVDAPDRLLKQELSSIVPHPLPSFPSAWLEVCVLLNPPRMYESRVLLDSPRALGSNQLLAFPFHLGPLERRLMLLASLFNVADLSCPCQGKQMPHL